MNSIELGSVVTPNIASQRGIQLVYKREAHGIPIILYRETRLRAGDVWHVTVNHIISTMSSIERVGMYAFSHS